MLQEWYFIFYIESYIIKVLDVHPCLFAEKNVIEGPRRWQTSIRLRHFSFSGVTGGPLSVSCLAVWVVSAQLNICCVKIINSTSHYQSGLPSTLLRWQLRTHTRHPECQTRPPPPQRTPNMDFRGKLSSQYKNYLETDFDARWNL